MVSEKKNLRKSTNCIFANQRNSIFWGFHVAVVKILLTFIDVLVEFQQARRS